MASPLDHLRRTPLRRELEARGATWRSLADAAIAETVAGRADARVLALADLSPLPRLGVKGREAIPALVSRGIELEAIPNRAYRQAGGGLALVLSPGEVLLLSNLQGDAGKLVEIESSLGLDSGERAYVMPRRDSHAWLLVTGSAAPAMLAKLCAIDLRVARFADLSVAQTSMAKMSAIVVRADIQQTPAFHLLADSAAALYFTSCLIDAAREFGGDWTGLAGLAELHAQDRA